MIGPPKTSGRIVIALQFWEGDKEATMRNARRIADNEPAYRKDVEVLFVARFDCAHDKDTVEYVAKKFPVSTYTTSRKGTGWPAGCNDVWADLFCSMCASQIFSGKWVDVKAVLTLEGDCIPVAPDWIDQLSNEWNKAAADGKYIVGCLMPGPKYGPYGHINGNALFAPDLFLRHYSIIGCPPDVGWDQHHGEVFHDHWMPTSLIMNYYRNVEVAEHHFVREGPDGRKPVLIHGIKDLSCEKYADRVLGEARRNK